MVQLRVCLQVVSGNPILLVIGLQHMTIRIEPSGKKSRYATIVTCLACLGCWLLAMTRHTVCFRDVPFESTINGLA